MAQTVFFNVTVDITTQADGANYRHTIVRATSAAGDVTVSFDPTKVKTISRMAKVFRDVMAYLENKAETVPGGVAGGGGPAAGAIDLTTGRVEPMLGGL